jgi:hypothetical protein
VNILKIKQTMLDKGIPMKIIEQFVFPKTEDETPEEKVAFAAQMDNLLSKEQILSVMEEQGCNKDKPSDEFMSKLKDKPIEERIKIMNAMDVSESARSRINDDGTLSIFWDFYDENGKYRCVCSIINQLSEPTTISLTYCGCCSGHVKYHFENFLGVKLRLIETVSSPINSDGAKQCEHRFEIINPELAMCGCRCDLCKAYAPNVKKNDQRETLAKMWNKYYGLDPSMMDSCGGCRNNPSDEDCPVRKCVIEKKLNHCGDCMDFPCDVFYQRCGSFSEDKKKDFDTDEYNEYILAYDNETRLKEYRAQQEQLKKVSEETMRFMRGKYTLDEVSNGKNEVAFYDGDQKILTIYIRDGYYDFAVGQEVVQVTNLDALEKIKEIIIAAKKPNRKPFPKEQAVYADCGHRCDLCVHYIGGTASEEFREKLHKHVCRIYGWNPDDEIPPCNGCSYGGIDGNFDCDQKKCARDKNVLRCIDCVEYACDKATVGWKPAIEARSISADDVTWAILPYVDGQYGN